MSQKIAATNTTIEDARGFLGTGTLFCPKKLWERFHLKHIAIPNKLPFPRGMLAPNGVTRIAMPTAHLDADTIITRLKSLGIEVTYVGINPGSLTYLKSQLSTPTGWIVSSNKTIPVNDVIRHNMGDFEHDAMLFADGLQLLGIHALENPKPLFDEILYFQCMDSSGGKLSGPEGFHIHIPVDQPKHMIIMRTNPIGGNNPPTMTAQRLIRPS